MSKLIFQRKNYNEICQETLQITKGILPEIISKSTQNIGTFLCDIISLDIEKIKNIKESFIPKNYQPESAEQISNKIAEAMYRNYVGKEPKKKTEREKVLKNQKEKLLKELINYSPIFSIYRETSIFDDIQKIISEIITYREYADLCISDHFYLNPHFISFLCDIEKFSLYKAPGFPLNYDVSKARNKSYQQLKIDFEKGLKNGDITTEFVANSFEDICSASLFELGINHLTIKKCENCGKYFIPYNRSDTIYCDRTSPQDISRTCKEYGSQRLWYDKLKSNESSKLYRNIYQSKQMLAKRNPDIIDYSNSFGKFKTQSKQWKADVKAGTKTEEEYIEWLKVAKEKKVL